MKDTTTVDEFLGGRLSIMQPARGFRSGIDAVLLAAAVPARPGQSVLELGCGVGTALLCLAARVPGLSLAGVEHQPDYGELALRNAARNAIPLDVQIADLTTLPDGLRARNFDHVIANPPYFRRNHGPAAQNAGREAALGEVLPLAIWIDVAKRRLTPNGTITIIQRADRLPDLLRSCGEGLGSVVVLPVSSRHARPAELILARIRKGGRAAFRLLAPLVLHSGESHSADAGAFASLSESVLRRGARLPLGD